jgi:small subunit ribosomal protein S2
MKLLFKKFWIMIGKKMLYSRFIKAKVHIGVHEEDVDPHMMPFIKSFKNRVSFIDLDISMSYIEKAKNVIRRIIEANGAILFISHNEEFDYLISNAAEMINMPFYNHDESLNIFETISRNILLKKKVKYLEELQKSSCWKNFTSFEKDRLVHQMLEFRSKINLEIKIKKVPMAIFLINVKTKAKVIADAQKHNILIFSIVNTDDDPLDLDYFIPANNLSKMSVGLILDTLFKQIIIKDEEYNNQNEIIRSELIEESGNDSKINLKPLTLKEQFISTFERITLYFWEPK